MTKIALYTKNQPRHAHLIEKLAGIASQVYVVQECATLFPGHVDEFQPASPTMAAYYDKMRRAEQTVFGEPRFNPRGVKVFPLRMGDLNRLQPHNLQEALACDVHIVFGSSWIKGWLADALIERRAINIHMGVSPQYRGSACNFWALRDGNPDLVGATIHLLSKGLDSGDILFHAFPKRGEIDPFELGMQAVRAAHACLVAKIGSGEIFSVAAIRQNRALELRHSRKADFTDEVALGFLDSLPTAAQLGLMLKQAPARELVRPFWG